MEYVVAMKPYTCSDYRQEMILAGLKRQLAQNGLTAEDKKSLEEQIHRLEVALGMD